MMPNKNLLQLSLEEVCRYKTMKLTRSPGICTTIYHNSIYLFLLKKKSNVGVLKLYMNNFLILK